MGKTIYIQCYEGLSAKMMVEALLDLMPEQKTAKATVDQLFALECPAEVKTAMIRRLPMKIKDFALPEAAETIFYRAYEIWLRAKAAVQKKNIGCVEFQEKDYDEVIAMLAAAICMERLEADTVICPIVYDGYGQIYVDHEPVSVPLPETLYILMGAEIAMHRMESENAWVTPEGAAFLAACRTSDHLPEHYHVSRIGTGRGIVSDGKPAVLRIMLLGGESTEESGNTEPTEAEKQKCPEEPTELQMQEEPAESIQTEEPEYLDEPDLPIEEAALEPEDDPTEEVPVYKEYELNAGTVEPEEAYEEESDADHTVNEIWKLECNIDDCGGEVLGYTMERLMENGALDTCYLPIYMKKNRPAYMMTVLCRPEDREKLEEIIFEETTTIGIRRVLMERSILKRRKSTEQTFLGEVAIKTMEKKNGEVPTLEYESVAAIAREQHLPFREVYRRIELELAKRNENV